MAAKEEEIRKELSWFRDVCDKRGREQEELRRQLDEAEKNIEGLLKEQNQLFGELNRAAVDRRLYDKLLLEQSLKEDALFVYEQQLEETRAELAEARADSEKSRTDLKTANQEIEKLEKEKNDLKVLNEFAYQRIRVLEQQKGTNVIQDILAARAIASPLIDAIPKPSEPAQPAVSKALQQPQVSSTFEQPPRLNSGFIENTAAHIAMAQLTISQFCGAYGLNLYGVDCDACSLMSDPNDRRTGGIQTEAMAEENRADATSRGDEESRGVKKMKNPERADDEPMESPKSAATRCPDCIDLKIECDNLANKLRSKNRRIDSLKSKLDSLESRLERRESELSKSKKAVSTYKEDVKKQNKNISNLLEKLTKMEEGEIDLKSQISRLEGRTVRKDSVATTLDVGSSSSLEQGEILDSSSGSSSDADDGRKRKRLGPTVDAINGNKDTLGIKLSVKSKSKELLQPTNQDLCSP